MRYANKSGFFWNFRNIQTATLIRKRMISALIDKARNSTAGNRERKRRMKSARMDIRAAGATPAFIRIGRALGVCVCKDEGGYRITRPRAERGQRSGKPPTPRVPKRKQAKQNGRKYATEVQMKAELKLLVGDVILLGIQSRINRRNRHSAWDTPTFILYRAGPRRF